MPNAVKYPACAHIKRTQPHVEVTKDIAEAIGRDFRTLPIFEKGLFEYTYKRYYSLGNNELLKCRWVQYKKHIEDRVFAPFQFVNIRDYHFYNYSIMLKPSETIFKKTCFRLKLKPGPGVDNGGQMPIPQDMMMKRGTSKSRKKPEQYPKEEKKEEESKEETKEK